MSGYPWLRRILPFLLIAALGVLFFAKLVFHPSWVLYTDYSDLLTYQIPQARFLAVPGSRPASCRCGAPTASRACRLSTTFRWEPSTLLICCSITCPKKRFGPALSWLIVAHVIVAGWTMFAYAR